MPTLEMNTSPAEQDSADRPKPAMRFTYPSGSRPLDGYTIKRGVGRGGFGEVYFAVSDAGKEVALKLIRRNLEIELRGVTQCLNLKHTNLIDIYDIRSDENDDRWVVMEYVAGASLEDFIERYPDGMPRDMVLQWFKGICAGVGYLHDHGIVHRDLKPANIFIDEGRIKIGDYGLSKFISCSRRSGQTESVGTVHYMAPEIANGRYGREIDTYALGIILYELLTGHVPFEGESVGEVLMKHLTAEPDLTVLDEPFREIVLGAMCKDPDRRIEHCSEMIAMLDGEQDFGKTAYFPPRHAVNVDSQPASSSDAVDPTASQPTFRAGEFGGATGPNGIPPRRPRPGVGPRGPYRRADSKEPMFAAAVAGLRSLKHAVHFDEWPIPVRVVTWAIAFVIFMFTLPVLLPTYVIFLVGYGFYRLIRALVLQDEGAHRPPVDRPISAPPHVNPSPSAVVQPVYASAPASSAEQDPPASPERIRRPWRRRQRHKTWREAVNTHLNAQTLRDRASELFGALLVAALVATIASFLICLFMWTPFQTELFLWMSVVSALASWAVMIPAKIAEGRVEDQAPMRFTMLILGALVGAVAFGLADVMFVALPNGGDFSLGPNDALFSEMFARDSVERLGDGHDSPVKLPLPMYAAYFAFTFAILRWWKLAECARSPRVGFWATAKCAGFAWLVTLFWWFPQPLGLLLAAAVAFSVQLSSPWLSANRRRELIEQQHKAQFA